MEEAQGYDPETGELPLISEKAVSASERAQKIAHDAMMGVHNARLNAAIMAALQKLKTFFVETDKAGAHKIKYATLRQILETVGPALHENGVRIRQGADRSFMLDEGGGTKGRLVPVYTDLIHVETGEIERTTVEMPVTLLNAQAMGSAITYGKRYTLLAALGLATDEADDDGDSTVSKSLDDDHRDSPALAAMTADMKKQGDLMKLEDWSRGQGKRFNALSAEEQAILKSRKAAYVNKLMQAPDDEAAPKKTRKAAE